MKLINKISYLLMLFASTWVACKPTTPPPQPERSYPAEPKFTITTNPNDKGRSVILSWASHTNFGSSGPSTGGVAYKVEVSTDGANFVSLPDEARRSLLNANDSKKEFIKDLPSTVKSVIVIGLNYDDKYYFKVTARNATGLTTSYTNAVPYRLASAGFVQSPYDANGPAKPNFDTKAAFLLYPTWNFAAQARYILLWKSTTMVSGQYNNLKGGNTTLLYKITFKDPAAMRASNKFGKPISESDVKSIELLYNNKLIAPFHLDRDFTLQNNLLPAVKNAPNKGIQGETRDLPPSSDYAPYSFTLDRGAQYAYYVIDKSTASEKQDVVAYKVRFILEGNYTTQQNYTPDTFNDSPVLFVDNANGTWQIVP